MAGFRWVRSTAELQRELALVGGGPLAVDTEADSFHRYRERVCLIQLSHAGGDLLVDPLAEVDPRALADPLADAGLRKILHGADYDLRLLRREFGLELRGVFDTMIAARLVGERAFGLASLLERHLDVWLDKTHQRADWAERPLPPALERYAVLDTRHLAELAARLEERLRALGRLAWAEEEFRALEAVRWNEAAEDDGERFRRVKGSRKLDRRRLALLRELHGLREDEARERDVAPFRVLRDDNLLALAEAAPAGATELARVRGLPRAWIAGRRAERVLGAVERVRGLADDELPEIRSRPRRAPDPAFEARVRRLAAGRDRIAARLGIEPQVLASRARLEESLREPGTGPAQDRPPGLRGWQRELLAPLLRELAP